MPSKRRTLAIALAQALALAAAFAAANPLAAQGKPPTPGTGSPTPANPDPAREFFARGDVVKVELTLPPASRQALRDKPREYTAAALRIDGKLSWAQVGVKLKGAAGSFQPIDERPGFTVHLGKFGASERFHGLLRFHLNNGVQDDSRLCEWLGHDLFTAAGHPAPRTGHAHLWLDGVDMGLYVLREGFDKQFLLRVFGTDAGNLYDGGFCQDLDADLEKDAGNGPADHSDLRRLRELCTGFDAERTARFEQAVDVEALLDFCALEAMVGHWDGYSQNRNNYRLWIGQAPGRARFLPHGMDQLFGDAEASILRHPPALAAGAVMQVPAWRKRYRERLRQLLPLFAPARLQPKVTAQAAKLRKELSGDAATAFQGAVQDLLGRLEARYRSLQQQVAAPEPKPLPFPGGRPVALRQWHPAAETDHLDLKKRSFEGVTALSLFSRQRGSEPLQGAWRTMLLLGKGRYRLLATGRSEGVEAPPKGDDGQPTGGVRLAVGDARSERLFGNQGWTKLACEFGIDAFQADVELRLELKAMQGKAWFRFDSLVLEKLPD
ncbi:MAG: CotH kinase family protein [Planctomycetes bacterium]|nr:CotH kinase family protein [Planctomycetota bacterium]